MSLEIERKWLVRSVHGIDPSDSSDIEQGYIISNKNESLRIRKQTYKDDWSDYILCVKTGSGLVRHETEIEITEDQFDMLWGLTEGKRISKNRSVVQLENDLVAEVDIFSNQDGLILVEVEFCSTIEASIFVAPDWFGEEVTHDEKYINANLAK